MIFESKSMSINFENAMSYLTFKEFEKYDFIKHAYTTRLGGVSRDEFKSLNFNTRDIKENVDENYNIFCKCMGVSKNNLAITSQVHKDNVCIVTKSNMKSVGNNLNIFKETDALITNEVGIGLVTFHADCPAIYMVDIKNKVIGLAHAGWRGTVQNIVGKLALKFLNEYDSSLEDIIVALGPSIGACCFEVSNEILENFYQLDIPDTYLLDSKNDNKLKVDLLEVNKQLLLKIGFKENNIFKSDICTMCNKDLLFSHRATQGKRGTNIAYLSLIN